MNLPDELNAAFQVEIHVRQQIGFCDHSGLCFSERDRVLLRLIGSLGYGEAYHSQRFTDVEHGGADQVSDVLHEDRRAVISGQVGNGMRHVMGRQVAGRAGFDLVDRGSDRANAGGVVVGGEISLDYGGGVRGIQLRDQLGEELGLAASRAADDVDESCISFSHFVAERVCVGAIVCQNVLFDANGGS